MYKLNIFRFNTLPNTSQSYTKNKLQLMLFCKVVFQAGGDEAVTLVVGVQSVHGKGVACRLRFGEDVANIQAINAVLGASFGNLGAIHA